MRFALTLQIFVSAQLLPLHWMLALPEQGDSNELQALDALLLLPTEHIPYLQVLMRTAHRHADAENVYLLWFQERSTRPLIIASYDEERVQVSPFMQDENRESFVLMVSMHRLSAVARAYVQRAGSFFFIITDTPVESELLTFLRMMWQQHSVYRIYVLTGGEVLVYDPFAVPTPGRSQGGIVSYTGEETLERLFFRDMRDYPLRVQIFRSVYARPILERTTKKLLRVEGVDWKVADLLQKRMNFKMMLQDPNPNYFGERDENGTYNGVIGSIIKNEVDVCFTGFFIKDYLAPEMDFTVAVYDDQLCIYVHKADRIPQSILPIFSVRYDLWLGFIVTAFICAGIWCFIRVLNIWLSVPQIPNEGLPYYWHSLSWQFISICVDTWVVWVRVNVVHFPPFDSERMFLASLCLVSVIFGAIFESSLATVYIHPLYYKDIYSMKELDDSQLKIIYKYSSMADDLFFSETSPLYASLNKKLTHLSNLNADVMLDISLNGGKAGVTRYTSLMLESFHFILSKKVWIIPECPKYYTISYVMPKDAPWEETMNNLLLRFLNAGLIKKWIAEMQTAVDIRMMKEHSIESEATFKVLTVANLQLAFYVVFAGSIGALLIFIVELCTRNHGKNENSIKSWSP